MDEVPALDWLAIVDEARAHFRFRREVLERARINRAIERALPEDAQFTYPGCDVCGAAGSDTDPVVDLFDTKVGDYVALAHYEGGCRQRFPEWLSDHDDNLAHEPAA